MNGCVTEAAFVAREGGKEGGRKGGREGRREGRKEGGREGGREGRKELLFSLFHARRILILSRQRGRSGKNGPKKGESAKGGLTVLSLGFC